MLPDAADNGAGRPKIGAGPPRRHEDLAMVSWWRMTSAMMKFNGMTLALQPPWS
ncbi:hypothetical protein ACFWY6_12510 [Streptomyces sp. NPDC059037]|uniref:hypothetical protein n=1 Tax=Streptomyces sp. NPDC059037 TaxID=3346710 RepID=UPI00369C15AC